ncbi:MAG: ATP-dependent DNA helicase RecQ [Candidatus Hydrogenedentes bacterium]|nr:ATP-dependent DNA helicase RecQ [Candidatus Hydrogenedentota bacterium]
MLGDTLRDVFGFDAYRGGQEAVVTRILGGKSVLAIFPTGGGKSLCYQLPALHLDGLTLVISPLIALMKDQLDFLIDHDVPAARLDSSLTREETLRLYDSLHAGRLKLLYISPERLGNERFLQTLRRQKISLLAIDEAHCISEWGHNFRPDYLKLARLARELRVERVLALTATATPGVADDIVKAFGIAGNDVVHTGFYRPNLTLRVTPCSSDERQALLLSRLRDRPLGPTIVYVTFQRSAEEVAAFLSGNGLDAKAYHAGMNSEDRNAVQDAFMDSGHMVIVATIAFGMGVDKADIRYVYHYNLPKSFESYSQEIGRAGRDGRASTCELLACADDIVTLENFTYGDTPGPEAVVSFVRDVLGRGDVFDISIYELSNAHDIRRLVVKTLLTYLELQNVIESTGPFYSEYKFRPQKSSKEILAGLDPERAEFLRGVFRHARKGKTWFSLDVGEVSERLNEPRERIVSALGYLEETGDLELQASGLRERYRVREFPRDMNGLCDALTDRFQRREENDIARIRQVVEFVQHDGCLTRRLLAYFGEEREDCGHCCRCEGLRVQDLPAARRGSIGSVPTDQLQRLREDDVVATAQGALDTSRQLARFLCGLSSPATSRARLRGHPLFGALEGVPFHEVVACPAVQSLACTPAEKH